MHTFDIEDAAVVLDSAQAMGRVGQQIEWRVVTDDHFQHQLLYWCKSTGWFKTMPYLQMKAQYG